MPPVGFEPTISAGKRPKTYPLDRAATGTGKEIGISLLNIQDDSKSNALTSRAHSLGPGH